MSIPDRVPTVILCGGKGTRLREYTEAMPKVLVEVGGRPILWHIMKIYAHYGFTDFNLCLGYLGEKIKEYFVSSRAGLGHDMRLRLESQDPPQMLGTNGKDWEITFVDTGVETNTGGRIKRMRSFLKGDIFFVTYGDGVADLDLRKLLDFHLAHGRVATVTRIRPTLNFGVLEVREDHTVSSFKEKPRLDLWINGGFFVFDHRVFDYLDDNSVLEQEPLERLAIDHQLMAYPHEGFWACMDTYKDTERLNELWTQGQASWKLWE